MFKTLQVEHITFFCKAQLQMFDFIMLNSQSSPKIMFYNILFVIFYLDSSYYTESLSLSSIVFNNLTSNDFFIFLLFQL